MKKKTAIIISVLIITTSVLAGGFSGWGSLTLNRVKEWIDDQVMTWTAAHTFSSTVTVDSLINVDHIKANGSDGLQLTEDGGVGMTINDAGKVTFGGEATFNEDDVDDNSSSPYTFYKASNASANINTLFSFAEKGVAEWKLGIGAGTAASAAGLNFTSDGSQADFIIHNNGFIGITDSVTAPSTNPANIVWIYVDTADGDLKIRFTNGQVVVIATQPL